MSIIRKLGHFRVEFSDLPIWATLVVLLCLASTLTVLFMSIITETLIYELAPSAPVLATGQTYSVNVMRGFVRYVTREDMERRAFWNDKIKFGLIGVVVIYLVLFPYRMRQES